MCPAFLMVNMETSIELLGYLLTPLIHMKIKEENQLKALI